VERDDWGVADKAGVLGVVSGRCSGRRTGQDGSQVSFAEDQDAVGEFGSGGQDEAFGEQFALGHRGGIFTVSIPAPARTASNEEVN
jgi:hypothetical protein